jgi:hypothetical protein
MGEMVASDKPSSLLGLVRKILKSIYNIDNWGQCYKTFFVLNLRTFVIS